jgi:rubrerythrin
MTIEEALRTALEYEAKVRAVYSDAVSRASDPVAKKVFGVLADEEQSHLHYLHQRLDELRETGKVTAGGLRTAIPSKEAIKEAVEKLRAKTRVPQKPAGGELDLFRSALQVETETSSFYKRMAEEMSPEGRELFRRFVEIEEGHLAIVQAEMDARTGLGYWFDVREFDLSGAA